MRGRLVIAALAACAVLFARGAGSEPVAWSDTIARARGQTVYWNAWAGDETTNAFIGWVGAEVKRRFGIDIVHVRLADTAEAVARIVAEKAAGRERGGSVDLVWINGANFFALKENGLLFGPFADRLPNARLVDTRVRSNVVDFTEPVAGFEVPWRRAQIVFVYDSARIDDPPRSMRALLDWARRHPGRTTHPDVRNFLGSTFLKQALHELAADPSRLARPVSDADFDAVTAPLFAWYDALRPNLWRHGERFPASGPAMRQLMSDGEIDLMISFNPAEAAVAARAGLLPASARAYALDAGTIGNTSFVAIPYNAAHKEAAMVVANFLLAPATQARAQDIRRTGSLSVLDPEKLSPADRALFDDLPQSPALPTARALGAPLPEPHPSWMTRIAAQWERRYTR
jgi:putative thiamine transport system substrate-binding protein